MQKLAKWKPVICNDEAIIITDYLGDKYTCHLESHDDVFANPRGNQLRKRLCILEGVVVRPLSGMITAVLIHMVMSLI